MTMIDHVSIGARDVARAKNIHDAALKPLGYSCPGASETSLGYGADAAAFRIGRSDRPAGLRADHGDNDDTAFVVDSDGYRIEARCGARA